MGFSIIIVNNRGWNRLLECLSSLGQISGKSFSYEVIVAGNAKDRYFLYTGTAVSKDFIRELPELSEKAQRLYMSSYRQLNSKVRESIAGGIFRLGLPDGLREYGYMSQISEL